MSDENNKKDQGPKPMHHSGHNPKTRRQFMAQGLLGVSALAFAPELLLKNAKAQTTTVTCVQQATVGLSPVIIIDLAGGGNIAGGNVVVGGAGGQMNFLQTYTSLGVVPSEHPSIAGNINQDMGIAFNSKSAMLQGIKDVASMTTQTQMEGTIFATISNDDTGNNQHNPIYWLNKAGAKGSLTQLAGTSASTSGGNSQAPIESINPTVAPVKVSSANDAKNLVSLGAALTGSYSANQLDRIVKGSANVSNNKLDNIPRRSLPDAIKQIVSCGFNGTADQVKTFTPNAVDPALDTIITNNFNKITDAGTRNASAPIVKLALDGFIGAATIQLGGFDYHNNTRTSGDSDDRRLGQLIGAIVESAAQKQKDVVIYVITDGGISSDGTPDPVSGRAVWQGDNGDRSASLMLVFKKDGRPAMRSQKRQIGYYQANGAVSPTAALTSNSVVNTAKAMVANYLALHGKEGTLEQVVNDDPFRLQLDNYLMFDKLR
jgi:hypothetical protein